MKRIRQEEAAQYQYPSGIFPFLFELIPERTTCARTRMLSMYDTYVVREYTTTIAIAVLDSKPRARAAQVLHGSRSRLDLHLRFLNGRLPRRMNPTDEEMLRETVFM